MTSTPPRNRLSPTVLHVVNFQPSNLTRHAWDRDLFLLIVDHHVVVISTTAHPGHSPLQPVFTLDFLHHTTLYPLNYRRLPFPTDGSIQSSNNSSPSFDPPSSPFPPNSAQPFHLSPGQLGGTDTTSRITAARNSTSPPPPLDEPYSPDFSSHTLHYSLNVPLSVLLIYQTHYVARESHYPAYRLVNHL
ncbi:hypothetical protein CC2G_006834 [Coprinopsis cinerea AmutBmut pab1-1]|nr:hypothetical protein CC2G_006834 [Coprinopsis cinerea AmutBmut pab1-1]